MKPEWVKVIRTSVQCLIALTFASPLIVPALGLSATAGVGATVLSVAALLTRVMQVPAVETLLAKLNLATPIPPSG